jgi:TRAP-type C4-dicarboxylate transport system permease large subunit
MSQVALPEMRKAGYDPGLSAGLIAAGGTLGIMIPPSVIFVLYGIMTETDITKLFFAGVVPGLLAVALYAALVAFIAHRHPGAFPAGRRHSWGERFATLKNLWPTLALFLLVLGSMYLGWVTVTEAAGIGAVGALAIGLLRGQLDRRTIKQRADRFAARVVGHHADRGRRLPVRLLPHRHPVHAEGGGPAGRPAHRRLRRAGAGDAGLPGAGRRDGRAG